MILFYKKKKKKTEVDEINFLQNNVLTVSFKIID